MVLTFLFIVDPIDSLLPAHDTSVALMEAAQLRGHKVLITTAERLGYRGSTVTAACTQVVLRPASLTGGTWFTDPEWYLLGPTKEVRLHEADAVFMRTDPPVDDAYLRATYLLDLVDSRRTLVVNSPSGLRDANEKLFILKVAGVDGQASLTPPTLVTSARTEIRDVVHSWGRAVLKPTDEMAGRGVMILDPDDPNLGSILDSATDRGCKHVVVQQWIGEVEAEGDRRLIVLDGVPIGSVRRRAVDGDFRCNMAAGGAPEADVVTDRDRQICARMAPMLRSHGLHLVGLDLIGPYVTEVNVTSPTGIREIDAVGTVQSAQEVIAWSEGQCAHLRSGGGRRSGVDRVTPDSRVPGNSRDLSDLERVRRGQ